MNSIENENIEIESKKNKSDQKIGSMTLDNIMVKAEDRKEELEENLGQIINKFDDSENKKEENYPHIPVNIF